MNTGSRERAEEAEPGVPDADPDEDPEGTGVEEDVADGFIDVDQLKTVGEGAGGEEEAKEEAPAVATGRGFEGLARKRRFSAASAAKLSCPRPPRADAETEEAAAVTAVLPMFLTRSSRTDVAGDAEEEEEAEGAEDVDVEGEGESAGPAEGPGSDDVDDVDTSVLSEGAPLLLTSEAFAVEASESLSAAEEAEEVTVVVVEGGSSRCTSSRNAVVEDPDCGIDCCCCCVEEEAVMAEAADANEAVDVGGLMLT